MFVGDRIVYHVLSVRLKLAVPLQFFQFPGFVLHSVLGRKLHQFSCALKRRDCGDCLLLRHCAYAYLFVSPNPDCSSILPGRDRLPHPWLIRVHQNDWERSPVTDLPLTLVLMGEAVRSTPILLLALREAGRDGLLNPRIPFEVQDVTLNGHAFAGESEGLGRIEADGVCWTLTDKPLYPPIDGLHLVTPLRIKVGGQYRDRLALQDILDAASSRLSVLCRCYGQQADQGTEWSARSGETKTDCTNLHWLDYGRWSARQKSAMKFGGVVGELRFPAVEDPLILALLEGALALGLGKNTSFGLGHVTRLVTESSERLS